MKTSLHNTVHKTSSLPNVKKPSHPTAVNKPVVTAVASVCAAVSLLFSPYHASANDTLSITDLPTIDRIVQIEAVKIPDIIVKLAEEDKPEVVAGLNSIVDQMEDIITQIQEDKIPEDADSVLNEIDSQLDMIRAMLE